MDNLEDKKIKTTYRKENRIGYILHKYNDVWWLYLIYFTVYCRGPWIASYDCAWTWWTLCIGCVQESCSEMSNPVYSRFVDFKIWIVVFDWKSSPLILDVLWGHPIKLIQVASNSELHENQWNDLLFFEIVPSHCFRASEVQT